MNESLAQRAEAVFIEAVDVEPSARNEFLESACAGNSALRNEVDAMLLAAERSSDYFEKLPERMGIAGLLRYQDAASRVVGTVGQQFGQYTLTEPVGAGGMGSVWRATRSDGRYEGEVAVKLLAAPSDGAAPERFAREARYLARLAHPNIARLLDAGVGEGGRPYLVLEFVDGQPIDRYCDEHALSIDARIRLFLQVLDAVAHAHAHLVVHRDIKPSNVQVTADRAVKLLDFGVAKLLGTDDDGRGGLTRELGAALTPEFAAPEQMNGDAVTTAADVYSLGLLLWVLLTGSNPRDTGSVRTLADLRAIACREPTRLSDAVTAAPAAAGLAVLARSRDASSTDYLKTLKSDLDNVVRKALAVEPLERYETVTDFAQDLRRYLAHEPVTAQAQTIRYRARKFVRRHRGGVLGASLTVLALVAAAAIATWQGIEAERQRDRAVYQQQRVQATNDFLAVLLSELGPEGRPLTLMELLDRGVEMLDTQFGAEEQFVARMLYDVSIFYATMEQADRQADLLSRSAGLARALDDRILLATVLCAQARAGLMDNPDLARARFAEGRALLERLRAPTLDAVQECYRAEAQIRESEGDRAAAVAALERALEAIDESPMPSGASRAVILNDLSEQYFKTDRATEALAMNAELLESLDRAGRGGTTSKIVYLMNRAAILSRMGEVVEAAAAQHAAMSRLGNLDSDGSMMVAVRGHYANSLLRLARYEEALELFEAGYAEAAATGNARWMAQYDLLIGRTLARMGRGTDAALRLAAAEAVYLETAGANERLLDAIALCRAEILLDAGDAAGASAAIARVLAAAGYPGRRDAPGISSILWSAATVALAAGDAAAAERYAGDGAAVASTVARDPRKSGDVGQLLRLRASARYALGDAAGAADDLETAIPALETGLGEAHPDTLLAYDLERRLPR